MKNMNIHEIDLSHNDIQEKGIQYLFDLVLQNNNIKKITVLENELNPSFRSTYAKKF